MSPLRIWQYISLALATVILILGGLTWYFSDVAHANHQLAAFPAQGFGSLRATPGYFFHPDKMQEYYNKPDVELKPLNDIGLYWLHFPQEGDWLFEANTGLSHIAATDTPDQYTEAMKSASLLGSALIPLTRKNDMGGTTYEYLDARDGRVFLTLEQTSDRLTIRHYNEYLELTMNTACSWEVLQGQPAKQVLVTDISGLLLSEPHSVTCKPDPDHLFWTITEQFGKPSVDLQKSQISVPLPWGEQLLVNMYDLNVSGLRIVKTGNEATATNTELGKYNPSNIRYTLPTIGVVLFKDGTADLPRPTPSENQHAWYAQLMYPRLGDVDQDGDLDAISEIDVRQGDHWKKYLAVALNQSGKALPLPTIQLPTYSQIKRMFLQAGELVVEVYEDPHQPLQLTSIRYKATAKGLEEHSRSQFKVKESL